MRENRLIELLVIVFLNYISSILANLAADALQWPAKAAAGASLIVFAMTLPLLLRREQEGEKKVPGYCKTIALIFFSWGVILVLAGIRQWSGAKIFNYGILVAILILAFGIITGWLSSSQIRSLVSNYWVERFKTTRQSLTRLQQRLANLLVDGSSYRQVRIVLLLIAVVMWVGVFILLQERIYNGFSVFVSLVQSAEKYANKVVFAALGLASLSALLAVLFAVASDRLRRLTDVFLAVAILALAMLFCTYTLAPPVIEIIIPPTPTLALTLTFGPTPIQMTSREIPTHTPTPTKTSVPTYTATITPISLPPVSLTPTWTLTVQASSTVITPTSTSTVIPTRIPVPTPTSIRPTSSPTPIPTPTRIQPPPPPPTKIPTPTRIQP